MRLKGAGDRIKQERADETDYKTNSGKPLSEFDAAAPRAFYSSYFHTPTFTKSVF